MFENLEPILRKALESDLTQRFGLSARQTSALMQNLVGILEKQSTDMGGLLQIGSSLLQGNSLTESLVNKLVEVLPDQLASSGEFELNTSAQITEFIKPKLQSILSDFLSGKKGKGSGGFDLGDFF